MRQWTDLNKVLLSRQHRLVFVVYTVCFGAIVAVRVSRVFWDQLWGATILDNPALLYNISILSIRGVLFRILLYKVYRNVKNASFHVRQIIRVKSCAIRSKVFGNEK